MGQTYCDECRPDTILYNCTLNLTLCPDCVEKTDVDVDCTYGLTWCGVCEQPTEAWNPGCTVAETNCPDCEGQPPTAWTVFLDCCRTVDTFNCLPKGGPHRPPTCHLFLCTAAPESGECSTVQEVDCTVGAGMDPCTINTVDCPATTNPIWCGDGTCREEDCTLRGVDCTIETEDCANTLHEGDDCAAPTCLPRYLCTADHNPCTVDGQDCTLDTQDCPSTTQVGGDHCEAPTCPPQSPCTAEGEACTVITQDCRNLYSLMAPPCNEETCAQIECTAYPAEVCTFEEQEPCLTWQPEECEGGKASLVSQRQPAISLASASACRGLWSTLLHCLHLA